MRRLAASLCTSAAAASLARCAAASASAARLSARRRTSFALERCAWRATSARAWRATSGLVAAARAARDRLLRRVA